jgi:hypothetical protein
MSRVLERVLGIDPALDADVRGFAALGHLAGFPDGHDGRRRQQSPDAVARPERPQRHDGRDEGDEPRGDEKEGNHAAMIPAANREPRELASGDEPWITGPDTAELVDNPR